MRFGFDHVMLALLIVLGLYWSFDYVKRYRADRNWTHLYVLIGTLIICACMALVLVDELLS
jgi:uncharacterized membrane protein